MSVSANAAEHRSHPWGREKNSYLRNEMNKIKLLYILKGLWIEKIDIFKEVMSFIGIVVTLNKFIDYTDEDILKQIINALNDIILWGVLCTFVYACYKYWPKNEYRYKIKGIKGDAFISICLGDVLSDKGSIVVPVNSCFDTAMDSNMISDECIQGQFQNKYFRNNLNSLDILIADALKSHDVYETIERSLPMKNKRYRLGTIAMINIPGYGNKKRVYLLSVANMSRFFNPESTSVNTYREMMDNFWKEMGTYGHNEKRLAISVLGVGRAGYPVDIELALAYMVDAYIETVKDKNIVENLAIYINWESIDKRNIKIDKIRKHIKAICNYKRLNF
jgi:hypothetical protein